MQITKIAAVIATAALSVGVAQAQVKRDMSNAGHDTANAGRDVGHGTSAAAHHTARGTRRVYHKTKHVTKKAYHKTENAGDHIAGKPATH